MFSRLLLINYWINTNILSSIFDIIKENTSIEFKENRNRIPLQKEFGDHPLTPALCEFWDEKVFFIFINEYFQYKVDISFLLNFLDYNNMDY